MIDFISKKEKKIKDLENLMKKLDQLSDQILTKQNYNSEIISIKNLTEQVREQLIHENTYSSIRNTD